MDFLQAVAREDKRSRLKKGSCILRDRMLAEIVEDVILFKRGERHSVHAWCVMFNHVHAIVTMSRLLSLNDWLGSVKKFSSRRINQELGRTGALWERESFNHLVRSEANFAQACKYVEMNPVEAKLCASPGDWPFSSARESAFRDPLEHFAPPSDTPFVVPRDRRELTHMIKEEGTYFVTFRLLDSVVLNRRR